MLPEAQLLGMMEHSGFGMLLTDEQGDILYANSRFCETSGCSLEELKGRSSRIFQSGQTSPEANISSAHRHATIDALTGLPNQDALIDTLSEMLSRSQDDGSGFSLFNLYIDRFESVDHALGPTGADRLVKEIVTRISAAVRADDLMARCGPGRFAVVLRGTLDKNICAETAGRILQRVAQPVEGHSVGVTGSIGIARYPLDAGNADDLLHAASLALAMAGKDGGNRYQFFVPEMEGQP